MIVKKIFPALRGMNLDFKHIKRKLLRSQYRKASILLFLKISFIFLLHLFRECLKKLLNSVRKTVLPYESIYPWKHFPILLIYEKALIGIFAEKGS